ncbi:MAG: transporter substrate-binding domain-containing protein [bacterium]
MNAYASRLRPAILSAILFAFLAAPASSKAAPAAAATGGADAPKTASVAGAKRAAEVAKPAGVPGAVPARKLVVATKVVPPFAFKKGDGTWTGISIDLWNEIALARHWDYEWKEAPNTNALVDMVAKGEADVGIAAITMKPSRAEIVDFSNSMYKSGLGIAVRSEPAGALQSLRTFLSGSFLEMIGGLMAILLVVGTLIWLFEHRVNAEQFERNPLRGVFSGVWWSAVTMTTVGYGDKAPRSAGGKVVGLLWMFAGVVMISSFTAVVASNLTTRQIASTVRGEEDLPHVRVGAKTGEAPFDVLHGKGMRPVAFASIEEGLKALASNQIDAFVHDQPVLKYELLENPSFGSALEVLPEAMQEEEYGIAVTPTQPPYRNVLREQINTALLDVKTTGKLKEIENRYLGKS